MASFIQLANIPAHKETDFMILTAETVLQPESSLDMWGGRGSAPGFLDTGVTGRAGYFESQPVVRSTTHLRAGNVFSPRSSGFSSPILLMCGMQPLKSASNSPWAWVSAPQSLCHASDESRLLSRALCRRRSRPNS